MTALRKFRFAQLRALRAPRRLASPSHHHGRAYRAQPALRLGSPRRAGGHWALAQALRLSAAVLFGLWSLAALGFWAAVAAALIW
jgi:hypothetical protein